MNIIYNYIPAKVKEPQWFKFYNTEEFVVTTQRDYTARAASRLDLIPYPKCFTQEFLSKFGDVDDMMLKITPEELALTEIEMMNMIYEDDYTNKEIRTWWLNQTEERRRDMVREYFKGGNSEGINTLYGIMPEEMEEMYNINVDIVIMDWEEILFDFIDFYPCQLPDELFEWLKENYEIPKKK